MGGFQGEFKSVAASDLGAAAIRAASNGLQFLPLTLTMC